MCNNVISCYPNGYRPVKTGIGLLFNILHEDLHSVCYGRLFIRSVSQAGQYYRHCPQQFFRFYHPYEYDNIFIEDAQAFLIAGPGVEIEVNVARWLRFGMGVSYRIVPSCDSDDLVSDGFEGFHGGFSLKQDCSDSRFHRSG